MDNWVPGLIQMKEKCITQATEQYLVTTAPAFGFQIDDETTKSIFKKFTYGDIRYDRLPPDDFTALVNEGGTPYRQTVQSKVGQIVISGNPSEGQRYIVTMFTQKMTGSPFMVNDTYQLREKWFTSCLNKLYKLDGIESLAMYEYIGCDKGSNWNSYMRVIEKFARKFPKVKTALYLGKHAKHKADVLKFEKLHQ